MRMFARTFAFIAGLSLLTLPVYAASNPSNVTSMLTRAVLGSYSSAVAAQLGTQIVTESGFAASYTYNSASSTTQDGTNVIWPSDHPATGRWLIGLQQTVHNTANPAFTIDQTDGTVVLKVNTQSTYSGTGTGTTGAPRLTVGTNTSSGDDSAILITRALSGSNLFSHAIRDESTFTSSVTGAYNTNDCAFKVTGSIHYNHFRCFQGRPEYAASGEVDEFGSDYAGVIVSNGLVDSLYEIHIVNATITAPAVVTAQVGMYIEALSGASSNVGIEDFNPNFLLSDLHISGVLDGITTLSASSQISGKDLVVTGSNTAFAAGGGVSLAGTGGGSAYGTLISYSNGAGTVKGFWLKSNNVIVGGTTGNPTSGAQLEVIGSASFTGTIQNSLTTVVGSLGTCNGGAIGTQKYVTDAAAAPVYGAIVAGGGAVYLRATCNGTNWVNL